MGLALGFLLFPVYVFVSIILMGWWGLSAFNVSFVLSIILLFFAEFILLFAPLMRADIETRLLAHAGFFSPWIMILYIALPQDDDPTPIVISALAVALFAIPGEMIVKRLKLNKKAGQAAPGLKKKAARI